jgi:hypothetical protein
MSIYRNQEKKYDVVVVGGGMAGICAALASARNGAKTAIVQARPVFGGNASSEIRINIKGAGCNNTKNDLYETGIIEELLLENKQRNKYHSFSIWDTILWEKIRFQKNLDSYLNTSMDAVEKNENKITCIICHQTTTETTYRFFADIFIDATGNGTLGFFAGAQYRIGSESSAEFCEADAPEKANEYTMGNTLLFIAEDTGKPVKFKKPAWAYSFTEDDLRYRIHSNVTTDQSENKYMEQYGVDSGYWWIELGGTSMDIIADNECITEDLYKCVYGIWDHIKNCGDHGAENFALTWVGTIPGTGESRRLVGDYILTENDIMTNRVFEDAVAYGGWPLEIHPPMGIFHKGPPAKFISFPGAYTIPYRCYYSKNIENLMMAGRNISTTKMAFSSTRVMGTCAVGGQAAGTAAAMAVRYACTPREIVAHMNELQQTLLKDDCHIPGYKNEDPFDLARTAQVSATSFVSGCEPENVINGVARQSGNAKNCWESDGISASGEEIILKLPEKKTLRQLRITFDPNLSIGIAPSISKNTKDSQIKGMPPELVKRYIIKVFNEFEQTYLSEVMENYQRLNIHDFPEAICGDCIRITVLETYGYPNAKIFEIRIY